MQERKKHLVYIGIFSVFVNLLMLVLPIYSLQIFDRVLSSRSPETLLLLAVLALGLLLIQALLDFIRTRLLNIGASQFEHYCVPHLVKHAFSIAGRTPDLARRTLQDSQEVKGGLASPMVALLFDLPWTPIFILVIFSLHPYLGWFAFAAATVLSLLTWLNLYLTRKSIDELAHQAFDNGAYLQRQIALGNTISLFNVADKLAQHWQSNNVNIIHLQNEYNFKLQFLQASIKYARMSLQVGVLALGGWLVITDQAVAGVLLAASILLGRVLAPLDQSINLWRPWRQSRAAWSRAEAVLSLPESEQRIEMPIEDISVQVEGFSVKDQFERLILKNVQFELKAGHALAIVGSSGSGKSTLLNAIAGVEYNHQGYIRLNGIALTEMLPRQRQQLIGYLPQ
ncbi:ATP-binding cassette domain-containing protein, partial [Vibrio sp. M260118]|uniref:ATP-binding cassette domain-containing protein n=1 Tax=Vibrio sp. M260118 TaxID=3020896 RepID=UPI002F3EF5A6